MKRWVLLAVGVPAALAAVAACVGSDPVVAEASDGGGDAAFVAVPDDADAVPIYAVFLTAKLYETDFASAVQPADKRAFVDNECVQAAKRAGLPHSENFGALIASGPEVILTSVTASPDAVALASAVNVVAGRWCRPKQAFGGGLTGCTAAEAIFASPASFKHGPDNALLHDETGSLSLTERGEFFSGLVVTAGSISIYSSSRIRNCFGWSTQSSAAPDAAVPDPEAGAGVDQDAATAGFGSVAPSSAPANSEYLWLAATAVACDANYKRPLLCLEHP